MKTTNNTTTKATKKATTNNVYVSTNEIFTSTDLKELSTIGLWKESEIDELFKSAHNKPQINTLNKDLKITLTTFYLCLPYEDKIKRVYAEKIRRFKWENQLLWDKDDKVFVDDEIQQEYLELKKTKNDLLKDVVEVRTNTLERVKSAILHQTYNYYLKLQANKNKESYELYKKLYKVAIAQYLTRYGVTPSMQLINYLCDETNVQGVNKSVNMENANIKIESTYKKYLYNFACAMVQALIDYKAINTDNYLHNELFANSLDNISTSNDLKTLQNIAKIDD